MNFFDNIDKVIHQQQHKLDWSKCGLMLSVKNLVLIAFP
jgi:hypothetical protein